MATSYKFDGIFYLILGLILVLFEWWYLKNNTGIEPYNGFNTLQYIWLIFGIILILVSVYILISNRN